MNIYKHAYIHKGGGRETKREGGERERTKRLLRYVI